MEKVYQGICIVSEQSYKQKILPVVYELIGKGKELKYELNTQVSVIVVGEISKEEKESLICYGADKVYHIAAPNEVLTESIEVTLIEQMINEIKPEIVLLAATMKGRSIAPRLSVRLKTGLTADCIGLKVEKETRRLLQIRPAMGESVEATIVCDKSYPQMATVKQNVFEMPIYDKQHEGESIEISPTIKSSMNLEEILICTERKDNHLENNEIVIAAGRGIGCKENMVYIKRFAELVHGDIAITRPLVEEEWDTYEHQVGQTGKIIKPKVYFAFGISGAIQHMIGVSSADLIIAINKDAKAPIFKYATYGIVGDAVEVLQVLIDFFKEK